MAAAVQPAVLLEKGREQRGVPLRQDSAPVDLASTSAERTPRQSAAQVQRVKEVGTHGGPAAAAQATPGFTGASRALAARLSSIARSFYHRGWALGATGSCSVALQLDPLKIAVLPAGTDRGAIRPEQLLEVGAHRALLAGLGRVPDDVDLALTIHESRRAGAVLHSSSSWGLLLADMLAEEGGVRLSGYTALNALGAVGPTGERQEQWVPIVECGRDRTMFLEHLRKLLTGNPLLCGVLLKGSGLYVWGSELSEAKRRIEVLELLFEVVGRGRFCLEARTFSRTPVDDDERQYVAPRRDGTCLA